MVGMLLGSILAFTIGIMLYSSFLGWFRTNAGVEMDRDARVSVEMFSWNIRPATFTDIEIPDPSHSNPSIRIGNKSFYLASNAGAPYSLWFDPDRTVANNEKEVIRKRVSAFNFVRNDPLHSVTISMTLQEKTDSLTYQSTICFRN
jgi:hypothetical protein